jgi:hypothetical protein
VIVSVIVIMMSIIETFLGNNSGYMRWEDAVVKANSLRAKWAAEAAARPRMEVCQMGFLAMQEA